MLIFGANVLGYQIPDLELVWNNILVIIPVSCCASLVIDFTRALLLYLDLLH
jgi:hypothetical protein